MTAFAAYRISGVVSVAISSVSSDGPRGGRAATPLGAATAAVRAGRKALELVAGDTEDSYLANNERQLAIERLLIRFGEALKSIPNQTLTQIDSKIAWAGPKGFRDIASHWYEEGLDHRLIWLALVNDLPHMLDALDRWIGASDKQLPAPAK
ncbi:MAG TPA: HepT-like ribonuclease domain-containing protein [Terriglobales bacterium]|nr:HepT-like ribonuclease domain-containing protein [Terriglobales bacterium]